MREKSALRPCFAAALGSDPMSEPLRLWQASRQQTSAEQGQSGAGIHEEGSLSQGVISKLKNLEEGNWGT